MPRTTYAYPFELKAGQFAAELSARFSAEGERRSFLLTLDPQGNVTALVFGDGTADLLARRQELESLGISHLFYDPFEDGMEYIWLSWHAVEPSVMERLIGQGFTASDFQPQPAYGSWAWGRAPLEGFPSSWGVMF